MSGPQPDSSVDHDSIVADWRQHAQQRDDENYEFLRSLKHRDYGFDPDEAAGEFHPRAFEIVDCTRCANCCRTMVVRLDAADIERIADRLGLPVPAFIESYLEPDEGGEGYQIRQRPCAFLGSDDRCTIYDVRPTVCREYPHTDKEGFTSRAIGHANNALQCPAVFWIVEQMRLRAAEGRPRRRHK